MRPLTQRGGVGLGLLLGLLAACADPEGGVRVGAQAPSFRLEALDGGRVDSRTLAGQAVVLNFWATWCQPCRKEIPVLQELAAEGRVRVVAIALDEEGARRVRPFVEKNGIEYTVLLGNREVFQRFDGLAIPYTLVLDGEGRVVSIYRGPARREDLARDLARVGRGAA